MTGLLLKTFSNKISEEILDGLFKNMHTFTFNAATGVSNTSYFITTTNTGDTAVYNDDIVQYYTGSGGTVVNGLSNGHLYKVTSANSTGFKLANVSSNATISLISGSSETHNLATHNPAYYFVVSKHSPWNNESIPDTPYDNISSVRDFQREIILGRRIDRTDVTYMIRKVDWAPGEGATVYAQYDDADESLFEKDFYVLTDENNVYKCLDNNNGIASTDKPTGKLTTRFQTSDGYIWKYMYTLSTANNVKFSTTEFIPVDPNTTISSAASNGAIEIVQVQNAGSGYTAFATGFVQQVISNTVFKVETETTSTANDYYNTSGFYIDAGTGSGQLTAITQYVVNTTGHFVITANNIDTPALDTTSSYVISPAVVFRGDGTGLKAYCNVAIEGNTYSISSVMILNRGQDYSYCTGELVSVYGSGGQIRPILSPDGGHGYNQAAELGATYICMSTSFANNESGLVSTNSKFRKTGLIYEPRLYSNGSLYYSNSVFSGLHKITATLSAPFTEFVEGEVFAGSTSGAHGIVAWANTSYIEYSYQYGTFQSSESITGLTSGAVASITTINTPDITKFNNEVLYYDYVLPIQRSNTTTETAKLLIAI